MYLQPGTDKMQASGQENSPALTTICPFCGLVARRCGSSKYEWQDDAGHIFALSATGNGDVEAIDVSNIGPISMGSS